VFQKILAVALMVWSMTAHAEYRMIVPQEPGAGTSVWATLVAKHLERHLGERIVIQHIPGARDIPGFNKFHNELRRDPKTIMVSHGGNAESFLTEPVDYDYRQYEPIGGMNLTIVTAHRVDSDPYAGKVKFASGSGNNPDAMAITLLVCGNLPDMQSYLQCFNERVVYVKGMKPADRRLAFRRGEITATRETPATFIKHVQPMIDAGQARVWFSHGVLDLRTGRVGADRNFTPGSFEAAYRQRHGQAPQGPLYESYLLAKQYRDVLQKALWMDRGNPNAERVRAALTALSRDPEAMAELRRDSGDYDWMIGQDLSRAVETLQALTNERTLQNLVSWYTQAFGVNAVYKPTLVRK
jgi:hypothetical protein